MYSVQARKSTNGFQQGQSQEDWPYHQMQTVHEGL
jgi:hypothetical protein